MAVDTSFVQVDSKKKGERRCYCCGDPECLLPTFPKKEQIPKKEWYRETGKCHVQVVAETSMVEVEDKVQVGFSGMQKIRKLEEPVKRFSLAAL